MEKMPPDHNWTDERFSRTTKRPSYRDQFEERHDAYIDNMTLIACALAILFMIVILLSGG